MKKRSYSNTIKRLNRGYYILFLLTILGAIYGVIEKKHLLLIYLIAGFGSLALLYFQIVKYYIQMELRLLSKIINSAIDGEKIEIAHDESELSLLTTKLSRFAKVRNMEIDDSKEQRKRVESLVADISHQTKTPISNIVLYSNLILENITDRKKVELCANNLNHQSEKLKWLIEKLIHMSRLENNIIQCDIKNYKIDELIFQSINQVYSRAIEKNIEIKYLSSSMKACFDIKWTSEAVANILDNAIKYSAENGEIEIEVIEYEQFLCIRIKDQGIGISEEEFPYIFQRFYRSKNVSDKEGLGIGLYLSRKILSSQKGYIKVKSTQADGTVFQVYLPLRINA